MEVTKKMNSKSGRNSPIGIFDSGLGGLTVLKEIHKLLPEEDIIYFGDNGRAPYGTKSKETVVRYTHQDINFLLSHNVKMIVIACNTASACCFPNIQYDLDIPLVEVVGPGAKAAANATVCGTVAVIGTPMTISSEVYKTALSKFAPEVRYFGKACPLFVPLAEEGWWDNHIARAVAEEYLKPVSESGADTLVLGCTHYPLLAGTISSVLGSVKLINSASAVANAVREKLIESDILCCQNKPGNIQYFTSDDAEKFISLGSLFIGETLKNVSKIEIEKYSN